jgi:menaquinone-specific isochorismate synthase
MRVVTTELPANLPALIERMPAKPITFLRNGEGLVAFGESVRLTATGPSRFADLSAAWVELVSRAEVQDSVQLPGTGLLAFGSIAFSDQSTTSSTLIVPKVIFGNRDGRNWVTTIDAAELPEVGPHPQSQSLQSALASASLSRSGFKAAVEKALGFISDGRVEKVVLARDLAAPLADGFDLRDPLVALAKTYPSCWVYSVDGMIGASPELLVRVSHGQVSARVLAGTAARGTDPNVDQAIGEALANSSKNLAEHRFAVDSMVRALEPFCDHVDADEVPFSLSLPNVWHLASDVHGVLSAEATVLDLAAAIHPTAAVAGTPRAEALEVIAELEPFDRGRYAGPVGWIGADGDGEWAIALRGAQIEGASIRAFAGCGIVAGSEPDSEATETDLKFRPITDSLG